jgi:integrase
VQSGTILITVKYVFAHPKTAILCYRRQFPKALQPLIRGGARGIKRSLRAKHISAPGAMQRWTEAQAEYDRIAAQARKVSEGRYDALDPPLIEYLAALYVHSAAEDDDRHRKALSPLERPYASRHDPEEDYEESREMIEGRHSQPSLPTDPQGFDREGLIAYWGPWVKDYTVALDHAFDPASEAFGDLCEAIAEAACALWLKTLGRRSDTQSRFAAPTPQRPERPKGTLATSAASLPMLPLFEKYAGRRGMAPAVRSEYRGFIAMLIAHVGHDDSRRLTPDEMRGWRDALLDTPTRTGKLLDPRTVRKRVRLFKSLFNWAVSEGLLTQNPCASVVVIVPFKAKLRERAFTSLEARTILTATLLPAPPRMSDGHRLARRWIPWLCAYSGARVGEMAQVRKADISEIDGVWAINVTPDAGTVKTKEARLVPIHSHLIDQGFLKAIASMQDGPLFYDPARQRATGDDNRHVKKVAERLGAWVRNDLGITDKGVAPNHGWRHTFKSIAYEQGMDARTSDAITGHAKGAVARDYERPALAVCAAAMAFFPRYEVVATTPTKG